MVKETVISRGISGEVKSSLELGSYRFYSNFLRGSVVCSHFVEGIFSLTNFEVVRIRSEVSKNLSFLQQVTVSYIVETSGQSRVTSYPFVDNNS